MKEIGSKIYYLKSNGNILMTIGDMSGYVQETSFEEDYDTYLELNKIKKENIGLIELEFRELSKLLDINKANTYKVDVSSEPHSLVFEWIDYDTGKPTEPPKTVDELIKEATDEAKLEFSMSVAELTEKIENDKLELSTAIIEAIEMATGGKS